MKKILTILFIMCISAQVFAKINPKQIVGKWKYTVETDQGEMHGIFNFSKIKGKLVGEVTNHLGETYKLSKVELKKDNTLYIEFNPVNATVVLTLKVEGDKFKGKGSAGEKEAPINGKKVE